MTSYLNSAIFIHIFTNNRLEANCYFLYSLNFSSLHGRCPVPHLSLALSFQPHSASLSVCSPSPLMQKHEHCCSCGRKEEMEENWGRRMRSKWENIQWSLVSLPTIPPVVLEQNQSPILYLLSPLSPSLCVTFSVPHNIVCVYYVITFGKFYPSLSEGRKTQTC